MATYLDAIIAAHRAPAAADTREVRDLVSRTDALAAPRGFRRSLLRSAAGSTDGSADGGASRLAVISEIKRRSPSKGDLRPSLDPASLAAEYECGGAAASSVLTDQLHFGALPDDLARARAASGLPVLRKDFTVSLIDVCDARLMGADCILLIVAALSDAELSDFSALAADLGLDVLVECHDVTEVNRCLEHTAGDLVGVNQRDLYTFEVDTDRAISLVADIPPTSVRVAESGVDGVEAATELAGGYDAILLGEHLVTSGDPAAAVRALSVPIPPTASTRTQTSVPPSKGL